MVFKILALSALATLGIAQAGESIHQACGETPAPTPAATTPGTTAPPMAIATSAPPPPPTEPTMSQAPTPAATTPKPVPTDAPTTQPANNEADPFPSWWKFTPVRSIKVRVQGNLPAWDADHQTFVTSFGSTFEEKYNGVLDTVNMASVEGMFKYVQAECINTSAVTNCQRKSNVKYIVFYETVVMQPTLALKKYMYTSNASDPAVIAEHCPYLAMDGGQCDPVNGVLPQECEEFAGSNGAQKLGFCVGGALYDQDYLAPYPNTYWYSFPNSCPMMPWSNKTIQCRTEQAGGLCPFGVKPDGVNCTFSFNILGWVNLDDVVGITSMVNPTTNKTYANYTEFCQAGGVEYEATTANNVLSRVQSIPFWKDPSSRTANAARVQKAVDAYAAQLAMNATSADGGKMLPIPSPDALRSANPPCYKNTPLCTKTNACRRDLYSQQCQVCVPGSSASCVSPPH